MLMYLEMVKRILRNEKGQGMAEYGLILALVAVATIAAFTALGTGINGLLGTVKGSL
jgi:pilus assembly protein Flp/PilA